MRERLKAQAGIIQSNGKHFDFAMLTKTEWSPQFEKLMRNRLIMGAMRYGKLKDKRKHPGKWNLVGAIKSKIKLWHQTGNDEYLVDIANYCLLEFECGNHPQKHFHALDDHHDHCKLK